MGLDGRDYYRPTGFGGFSVFPPVIKTLLIINVAVFFVQIIFENLSFGGVPGWYVLNRYFALNPIAGMDQADQPFNFQIWQLISYQFMHSTSGFGHIFFNMLMLWMFGMELENMWGSKKFLLFYLISGIGAGIAHVFISPLFAGGSAPTIGASGAVYGIMLAFAMFFPNRYIYIWFLLPVKAKYLIAFLILIEFMSVGGPSLVAHLAHLGGALTAFIMIMADKKYRLDVDRMYYNLKNKFQSYSSGETEYKFRKPKNLSGDEEVIDAEFYEINERKSKSEEVTQEEIDRILDKISQSGYQNLTEKEKKVLFEASKKS